MSVKLKELKVGNIKRLNYDSLALGARSASRPEPLHTGGYTKRDSKRQSQTAPVDAGRTARTSGPFIQRGAVRASNNRHGRSPLIGGIVGAMLAMTVFLTAGAVFNLPLVAMLLVSVAAGLLFGSITAFVLRVFLHETNKQGRTDPAVPSVAPTERPRAAQRPVRKARSYFEQHGTASNLG